MKKNGKMDKIAQAAKIWAGAITAAFIASVAIYFVLLQVERDALSEYEKREVYVAACEIPAGQMIDQENIGTFFQCVQMDCKLVPETALKTPEQVRELAASGDIEKGVILTEGMFRELDEILAGMEHPVIAGFRAEDLFQVVGGVLRAGDRIHIYSAEEEEGTILIWEDVYIQQVFDSGGAAIANSDRESAAQRINIYLDKEDVERFYSRLERGSLRVVKDWR